MKEKKKKPRPQIAVGVLRVHPRGFGFLIPNDKTTFPQDIFIPKQAINQAVDGDSVEVVVSPVALSEKGPEGRVNRIIRRGRTHIIGTVRILFKGGALVHSPVLGQAEIRVQFEGKKLKVGDRIVMHILDWNQPLGRVTSVIGNISNPSSDVPAAIEEYDLAVKFPKEVVQQAKSFGTKVETKEINERVDLRYLECFTIDPETAKDFDDAISLERDREGNYLLGVHIADVSHYVQPGTPLDKEASSRCNSIYFPGTVIPMLPHELSSHLCSLKANLNRLTASVLITLDLEGNVIHYAIVRSVIKSRKRFTYPEALEVLENQRKSPHQKKLIEMVELCQLLKRKRYERGCIEFSFPEVKITADKDGKPSKLAIVPYDITHQLVEEFMLKANEIVATHCAKLGKPLTYRVHEEPKIDNIRDFSQLAQTLGFKISDNPASEELQRLFEEAKQSPMGQFLATAYIRSMKLASYSTQNVGHYGLGLEYYAHFTSPIRRYIDLIVHRVLFDESKLTESELETIAVSCSEKERISSKAENGVIHLKKLRLLSSLHAENPTRHFDAIITTIKPFGFVFELPDFLLDGFIFLDELAGNDVFFFDEMKKRLVGARGEKKFQAGDAIRVRVEGISLITQETKWSLVRKPKK